MKWNADKFLTLFLSSAIFVLLPFIYVLKLQDVEISIRFLYLAILVSVSSLFFIIYVVREKIFLRWDSVFIPVGLILMISFIGIFRSINFGDGYFEFLKLFLMLILFFQMLVLFSANENNKFIFFKTICISALIFISFGLMQFLPIVKKGDFSEINYALSSTLGNKNFFAETLLLMFPVCIASSFLFRKVWRWLSAFCSFSILITLIVLQTLSTWVAALLSVAIVLIMTVKFRNRLFTSTRDLKRFYAAISLSALVVFGGILFGITATGGAPLKSRIETFKNILKPETEDPFTANQNSTYERLFLLENSGKIIADHPLFGCGMANWKIILPSYGMGNAGYMTNDATRFVHPHNDFLLLAAETGLVGLIVYLTFLLLLIYYVSRWISLTTSRDQILLALLMIFGVIAFIIISNFSMPMSRIYPPILLMLFAAIIISEYQRLKTKGVKISWVVIVFICVVSLTASLAATLSGSKRLKADLLLSKALLEDRKKNYELMRQHLEKIDKTVFPVDVTATPIAWYQGYAWYYLGNLEGAFNSFKEAEQINPNHLTLLNDLGTCYNLKGDSKTALQYYRKILDIQPVFYDALINLAVIYFNQGELEHSYNTVIKVTGKIEPLSIRNISAIILAKAKTIITDEEKLSKLEKVASRPLQLEKLLLDLRTQKGDIQFVVDHL